MRFTTVSLIISNHTRLIESTLLQTETSFATEEEAKSYADELEQWMQEMPVPGEIKRKTIVRPVYSDHASELAARLPEIIAPRDADLFKGYYHDREAEAATVDRRPYDWSHTD